MWNDAHEHKRRTNANHGKLNKIDEFKASIKFILLSFICHKDSSCLKWMWDSKLSLIERIGHLSLLWNPRVFICMLILTVITTTLYVLLSNSCFDQTNSVLSKRSMSFSRRCLLNVSWKLICVTRKIRSLTYGDFPKPYMIFILYTLIYMQVNKKINLKRV